MAAMSVPANFSTAIDIGKCNLDVIRPWVATQLTELLGIEDDVVIELVLSMLEDGGGSTLGSKLDPRVMQWSLRGFLGEQPAKTFMQELWGLLISAQSSPGGVPKSFVEEKKAQLAVEKRKADEAFGGRADRPVQSIDEYERPIRRHAGPDRRRFDDDRSYQVRDRRGDARQPAEYDRRGGRYGDGRPYDKRDHSLDRRRPERRRSRSPRMTRRDYSRSPPRRSRPSRYSRSPDRRGALRDRSPRRGRSRSYSRSPRRERPRDSGRSRQRARSRDYSRTPSRSPRRARRRDHSQAPPRRDNRRSPPPRRSRDYSRSPPRRDRPRARSRTPRRARSRDRRSRSSSNLSSILTYPSSSDSRSASRDRPVANIGPTPTPAPLPTNVETSDTAKEVRARIEAMKREQSARQVRLRIEELKSGRSTGDAAEPSPTQQPSSRPSTAGTWTAILRELPQSSS